MKVKKSEISKMIKTEYKEARLFCRGGRGRVYRMMIDTSDAQIWSDVFLSGDSWKVYHSKSIKKLSVEPQTSVKAQENAYIEEAIRLLKKSGWEIE